MPYVSEKLLTQCNQKLIKNKYRNEYILNHLQNAVMEAGDFNTKNENFINKFMFFTHFTKYKKTALYYPLKNFYTYVKGTNQITKEKIDKFLDFTLIQKEVFIEKYNFLRKQSSEKDSAFMSYETLQKVDRFLPKVSFYYPFITDKEKKYISNFVQFIY